MPNLGKRTTRIGQDDPRQLGPAEPQHIEVWAAAELLKRSIHRLRRNGVFPNEVRDLVEARLAVESEGPREPGIEKVLKP